MGRKKKLPILENLVITDIATEGRSIAKYGDIVVFISNTVPGDIVNVQITKKRKRYLEGYPVEYVKYSDERSSPFCSHFGVCGGCRWQHMSYSGHLNYKQKLIVENLKRIGKCEGFKTESIIASEYQTAYRNKLEYTFSTNRWLSNEEINDREVTADRRALGFHIPGRFDRILDIKKCFLQPEPSNLIRLFVRDYAKDKNLEFFDQVKQTGFLRNLIIRNNSSGEFMLVFSFFYKDFEVIENLLTAVNNEFPEVTSLNYVINSKANDTINDLEIINFKGEGHITEEMEGIKFRISPVSFFQTNSRQAYKLYTVAREFASLTGSETVYDLYCGTGTITLFLAKFCKSIIGIEYIRDAINDAIGNSNVNKISNTSFYAGDIKDVFNNTLFEKHGSPDVVITDPPRSGMHPDVTEAIINSEPSRIVYVSCNPATQARDIELLSVKYKLLKIQPVDMFPFTEHVENVALLIRKDL